MTIPHRHQDVQCGKEKKVKYHLTNLVLPKKKKKTTKKRKSHRVGKESTSKVNGVEGFNGILLMFESKLGQLVVMFGYAEHRVSHSSPLHHHHRHTFAPGGTVPRHIEFNDHTNTTCQAILYNCRYIFRHIHCKYKHH